MFSLDSEIWAKHKVSLLLCALGLLLFGGGVGFSRSNRPKTAIWILTPSPSPLGRILVDVAGEVVSPGVYQLPVGSRLQLAIQSAGGLTPQANLAWVAKHLNLAARLSDGQKIYIPKIGEEETPQIKNPGAWQININTADVEELETLPGVGPKTAKKIIANRPYQKVEDLLLKKIVGRSVFAKIKEKIRV